MNWSPKTRAATVCCGLAVIFSVYSYRLIHIQVGQHEKYAAIASKKHVVRQDVFARRGIVYDVNYEVLADTVPLKLVYADPTHITDADTAARVVSDVLKLPYADVLKRITLDKKYTRLKREVPIDVADNLVEELRAKSVKGIYFDHDSGRVYPNGSLLSHVIGFVNFDRIGVEGVERAMENYLQGQDGYRSIERDRTGKELVVYRGQESAPKDGYDVRLTVDMSLQMIVENELDAAIKEYNPKGATVVMMRPQTGEILALANRPTFDINERSKARIENMKNRAVVDMFEPGSIFKIVTVAAALNERVVRPGSLIRCENGAYAYGGKILHDHHPYGDLSVHDVIMKSSNIGVAKIAIQLTDRKLYDYIRLFGFGEPTSVGLPGESPGLLNSFKDWSKLSITHVPMGHEICVTPLQMASAMSVIANGGKLMMPHVVHSIVDSQHNVVSEVPPKELRQVLRPEVAKQMRDMLKDVLSKKGTAYAANVPGYTAAGKTGTAQKLDASGHYLHDKYVVSFVGYLPADDPKFVLLVSLDDAHAKPGQNYGGLVAGPIFSRIAAEAARYLDIEPHGDPSPKDNIVVALTAKD